MPPTLASRMIWSLACMVLGSLAIGGVSIVAVNGLHQDLGITVQGYRQLRQVFDVGFLASKAREALSETPPQPQRAITALQAGLQMIDERSDSTAQEGPPQQWIDESSRADCRGLLTRSIDQLSHGSGSAQSLNLLFGRLADVAGDVRKAIAGIQKAADRKRNTTLLSILCWVGAVNLGMIVIGIRHYHRVIRPIHQLGEGVRTFTAGNLDHRMNLTGDREFVGLANDFDRMADQLSALYRDLEIKVASKSKELVRSQRLAGVGYLAAGVAHEINNPLGIIAGYAERAMQHLSEGANEAAQQQAQAAFSIICEQAFRCKQITASLLSLARPGGGTLEIVSLAGVAEAMVSTLTGLQPMKNRGLTLAIDPEADLRVRANEGEIKQLLLNLIINSMEAVDSEHGKVHIEISRQGSEIQLSIGDNGHGMTPQTLDQIFQPFFSEKRDHRRGTGLGLSIAQAIVSEHAGSIQAYSAGPGLGSTFTVRLPAVTQEPAVAHT